MTGYAVGTRFEHKVIRHLVVNGYQVIRAAGSKGSTKVDIVAVKPGQLLFIQCKRDGRLPAEEWDRLFHVADWVAACPILAANGLRGRGVQYQRLLGTKRPRARIQPVETFLLDELGGE